MGQFYDKIWDEDRVFLFLYFKEYYYDKQYDKNNSSIILPIRVSKIREKIKKFDKYGLTNEQFKQNLIDLTYCKDTNATEDSITIQDGVIDDIREKINEINTIFLSEKFLEFLCNQQMFSEKRIIIDYITKIKIQQNNYNDKNDIQNEFIEFLVNHFCILTDLFLQHRGKMIF